MPGKNVRTSEESTGRLYGWKIKSRLAEGITIIVEQIHINGSRAV